MRPATSTNSMARRGEALGFQQLAQAGQAGVRDGHHPGVGADGAEGVGGHFRRACGQGIEDGGLPGVGQADDAAAPTHGGNSAVAWRVGAGGNCSFGERRLSGMTALL